MTHTPESARLPAELMKRGGGWRVESFMQSVAVNDYSKRSEESKEKAPSLAHCTRLGAVLLLE
jgi:hypothetical protein